MNIVRIACCPIAGALAVVAVPASAATITFSNFDMSGAFGGNGRPVTSYTEAGFTLTAPAAQYQQAVNMLDGSDNALLTGQYNTTPTALLTLTGSSPFTFRSFDAAAHSSAATYTVTGYVGETQIYTNSGAISVAAGTFPNGTPSAGTYTTYSEFNSATVDRVTIATNAPFQLFLDNITTGSAVVAAVPEPTNWAMMIVGFGLIGGTMRRRPGATVRFAR